MVDKVDIISPMQLMTYGEYIGFYLKQGRTVDQSSKPKNVLNEATLKRKYDRYLLKMERKENKFKELVSSVDEQWEQLKKDLTQRDGPDCKLYAMLQGSATIRNTLIEYAGHLLYTCDVAHIFPKGSYKFLYYDLDDVVWLNRFSHTMLDGNRNPITGEYISTKQKEDWWRLIAGDEVYDRLLQKIKEERG